MRTLTAVTLVALFCGAGCGSHHGKTGSSDLGPPPAMTCALPISPAPATSPTVVGTGAGTCTQMALAFAVAKGGAITFDCGGAATIAIDSEVALATDRDTSIDGGGMVTLDGGGKTRILHFAGTDYRGMYGGPEPTVTIQNLTFTNGKASGTAITVPAGAPAECSRGVGTDGGGGAYPGRERRAARPQLDAFTNNQAAQLGPDVAGGAIYAIGSTDLTIVGSRFSGNSASNGGAVGCLNSDLTIVNDTFESSSATGNGANSVDTSKCPATVNNGQIGSGGNGGAISIDGGSDGTVTICGCTFAHNTAGAFGGAMFRTPDKATQLMQIDLSTFDSNSAPTSGGGVMYIQNSTLHLTGSTLSNNSAVLGGAFQADTVQFTLTNVTVTGNTATDSNGGAFFVSDGMSSGVGRHLHQRHGRQQPGAKHRRVSVVRRRDFRRGVRVEQLPHRQQQRQRQQRPPGLRPHRHRQQLAGVADEQHAGLRRQHHVRRSHVGRAGRQRRRHLHHGPQRGTIGGADRYQLSGDGSDRSCAGQSVHRRRV